MKKSLLAFMAGALFLAACGNSGSEFIGYWGNARVEIYFEITHNSDNQYYLSSGGKKEIAIYKDGMLEVDGSKIALDKKTGKMNYKGLELTKLSPKEFAAYEVKRDERSRNAAAQAILQQISFAQVALDTSPDENRGYVSTDGSTGKPAAAELFDLGRFGFRPDPEVAFAITVAPGGKGFIAIAGHTAKGSIVYIYEYSGSVFYYDANYRPPANVKLPATLHTYTCSDDRCSKVTQGQARTYTRPTGAGHDGAAKMK